MILTPIHETDEETEVSRSTVTSFPGLNSLPSPRLPLHCPGDGLAWPTRTGFRGGGVLGGVAP